MGGIVEILRDNNHKNTRKTSTFGKKDFSQKIIHILTKYAISTRNGIIASPTFNLEHNIVETNITS